MPTETQARNRRQQQVDPVLRQEAGFRTRPAQVHPTIVRAIALGEAAIRHNVPVGVVVFAAGSRAEDVVRGLAQRRKAGISLLQQDRLRETARFHLRDANGWPLQLPRPHIAVEELVPLLPTNAYRPVNVHEPTDGCFTLAVRLPGLGKVRLVVSFAQESLTGRSVVLGTNRVDWSAAKIIGLYLQRWPTETFEQDGQGPLGLDAYRMRSTEAMGKHWCLVFVASSLLPLTSLPAGPERPQGLLQTRGEACRQQGRALIHKLLLFVHDQWAHGASADPVLAQLVAKQRGMVPV